MKVPERSRQTFRQVAAWLATALALLVMVAESAAGLVAAAWLVFAALAWRSATQVLPARASLNNVAVAGFIVFPCLAAILLLGFGGNWAVADNPSRFLLALPVIVVVAGLAPSVKPFFNAQAIGGCYVGAFAIFQVLVQGIVPASGITNPNKFGYVGATYALLCLACARLRRPVRPPRWLLAAGVAMGMAAMLLSGTRGTWIAFSVALCGWFVLSRSLRARTRLMVVAAMGAGATAFALIEGTIVQQRWSRTSGEVAAYLAGDWRESSIGERFELWRAAIVMITEHPLSGVGLGNYPKFLRDLVAQGRIDAQVVDHGHAHNEYLNWFATGGLAGLIGVMAALLLPLLYFVRESWTASALSRGPIAPHLQPALELRRAAALAGSLFVLATAVFCLFDAFFYIHFATVYYAFTVAVLIGFVESSRS